MPFAFLSSSTPPAERPHTGAADDLLARGTLVGGRYRIEALLGRGGMGTVYAAHDVEEGARVALKLMHPHLGSLSDARRRFHNEASALCRLRSDYVARLHDFGHHEGGAPFLVMEHVPGHDLGREVARTGPLAWPEAYVIVDQVCCALSDVHGEGLVHRDLKPRNIVLTRGEGTLVAKLVDFGLSKSLLGELPDGGAHITSEGAVVGSLHYMAPEQTTGRGEVDERTDVFSVACILYFLLMGRPPFSQRALTRAGTLGTPLVFASVHRHREDVPAYVDEVLRVALAPRPDERFRSIGALRMALASDIPGCSPPPRPEPTPLRPVSLMLGAGLTLVLLVLALHQLLA